MAPACRHSFFSCPAGTSTMSFLFQCELMHQPFGDPVLYVRFMGEKKALLFDLGDVSRLHSGKLLKVSHVFVTHTHIDHFIGFDHLLRLNLARDKTLCIYGPKGIIKNVKGKLQGYTWNLVDEYPFIIEVIEIGSTKLTKAQFICKDKFKAGKVKESFFDAAIEVHPHYTIKALMTDHRIASIAYSLEEGLHININKDRLLSLGLPVGKWLGELKDCIRDGRPETWPVHIQEGGIDKELPLGELTREIVTIARGQKIVYVADCRGTEKNIDRIIPFAAGADVLFCEAAFLDKDREKAADRGHLTARQAGYIARQAGVQALEVFHFSHRYEGCPELLYQEAEQEFTHPQGQERSMRDGE
ncbi:MAG: ribonuclease Z [Pseudomonadota bacterium]